MLPGRPYPPPSTYLTIFGDNLHEIWLANYGITKTGNNISSWQGFKNGYTFTQVPSKPPVHLADGSNFKSRQVVQFTYSLNNGFNPLVFPTPLGTTSANPEMFLLCRFTAATTEAQGQQYVCGIYAPDNETGYTQKSWTFTTLGSPPSKVSGETWLYIASPTYMHHAFPTLTTDYQNVHILSGYQGRESTVSCRCYVDGTQTGTFVMQEVDFGRIYSARLGLHTDIPRGSDMAVAMFGITKVPMTSAQRKALNTLAAIDWGCPLPT